MNFSIGEIAIIWYPKSSQSGYNMSAFHGVECEIRSYASGQFKEQLNCDYEIITPNQMIFYIMESELRKKPQDEDDASHYDGTVVSSWDAEGTVWKPEKELTEA